QVPAEGRVLVGDVGSETIDRAGEPRRGRAVDRRDPARRGGAVGPGVGEAGRQHLAADDAVRGGAPAAGAAAGRADGRGAGRRRSDSGPRTTAPAPARTRRGTNPAARVIEQENRRRLTTAAQSHSADHSENKVEKTSARNSIIR